MKNPAVPIVSIITPMHNSAQYITETIESVQNQTIDNFEMIIIDDCSTDDSAMVVKSIIKEDPRIKIIKLNKNSGAAIARNEGIKAALGKYIAFLDSDDLWLSKKLEIQLSFMQQEDISFSYTGYIKINENGIDQGRRIHVPSHISYKQLLKTCSIGCLTAVYDAEKLGKIYMPNIRKRQDYALWLKILRKLTDAYGIDEPLAKYRVRENSISSNKLKAAAYQWKVYRDIEKLSFIKSIYYFIHYAYYGYKKYKI